jgi:hypothetical protein
MDHIRIDEISYLELGDLLYRKIPCPGCQGGGCPTCMGQGYWGEEKNTLIWEELSITIYKKDKI